MHSDGQGFDLAHDNLRDAMYPHLRSDFDKKLTSKCGREHKADSLTFFPHTCCPKDAKFCKRTCGLFKQEYIGKSMIALCSKTYVVENDGPYKLSCKGINEKTVSDPIEIMSKVLEDQISRSSVNRGFRARNNTMFTNSQTRVGFNY